MALTSWTHMFAGELQNSRLEPTLAFGSRGSAAERYPA